MRPDSERGSAAAPPGLSWTALYAIVILALVLQIAAFAVLTAIYK
ncbi:MAG: hypothetical protein ABSB49_16345 [Polyangia bacterium]|jgi:hypothetical protein